MALTWTDEQLAVTIWVGSTIGPWLVIEGWVRWNRFLDRIAAAGAALALLADADTRVDLQGTGSADDGNPDLRVAAARAPVDGNPRL